MVFLYYLFLKYICLFQTNDVLLQYQSQQTLYIMNIYQINFEMRIGDYRKEFTRFVKATTLPLAKALLYTHFSEQGLVVIFLNSISESIKPASHPWDISI